MELLEDVGLMAARVALSSNGRNGQYVGTSRVTPPTATAGSPTARLFNGLSDRIVGPRSSDLGAEFAVLLSFWRADGSILANDLTAARLFTQYCQGGTRVAVGINRSKLSVTYTTTSGLVFTVESQLSILDTDRHLLTLRVTSTQILVYLEGREVIKVDADLRAPDNSLCNIGSDNDARFFKGYIDDIATYQAMPNHFTNWLRYYSAVTRKANPRDFTPAPWSAGYNSAVIFSDGFAATGSSVAPTSRVRQGTAFRAEAQLNPQFLEFTYSPGDGSVMLGVMTDAHNLATHDIGTTLDSYAYTEDGRLRRGDIDIASGIATWNYSNVMALGWDNATSTLSLWKDGIQIHSQVLAGGPWFPAASIGTRTLQMNVGQAVWLSLPAPTQGLYSLAWSRLATEFREMKVGEVAALLNDTDLTLRDAQSGAARGVYLDPPGALTAGITTDSLDIARTVGAGIRIPAAAWTTADLDFFFALAFSPTAADLVGEKILLQSPGKWTMSLVDGKLYAEVGGVNVGSPTEAFEEGRRYFIGILRGTTGKLMVWNPSGFLLQSADATVAQTAEDVWVAGASDGSKQLEGKISHLVLSSTRPAPWKLDRLAKADVWDEPFIEGLEPTVPSIRRAVEPSWRDVVANLEVTAPTDDACYFATMIAQPDELTLDYRLVARTGSDPFEGERVSGFAPYGLLGSAVARTADPAVVTLTSPNDLDRVTIGSSAVIGEEICRVSALHLPTSTVTLERGCADTLPADHPLGSPVWFPDGNLGSDLVPRLSGVTVDGKALARTALDEVDESLTPTDSLPMTGRLARPYPPAFLLINEEQEPADLVGTVEVKWRHRNKVTQGAGLIPYGFESIAAPATVTYVVRMYDATTNALLAESVELNSEVVAYDLHAEFDGLVRVTVTSYEDGQACWQVPEKTFNYTGIVTVLMTTEMGEPLTGEEGEGLLLEDDSAAVYSSFSGHPAGSYRTEEEEEEEEAGMSPMAVGGIIGVPISELPANTPPLAGTEIFPIVRGGENYYETLTKVFEFVQSTLPPPVDGKSAYQIWLDEGNTGTEADFLASLQGAQGLPSNVSRRIQTINSASGAIICNWALYDEIRLRLVGDVSLVFQNAVDGQGCLLKLTQDAAGGRAVTLPASVRYNTLLTAYVASSAPGLADKVGFIYDSGDSKYDLVSLVPGII